MPKVTAIEERRHLPLVPVKCACGVRQLVPARSSKSAVIVPAPRCSSCRAMLESPVRP